MIERPKMKAESLPKARRLSSNIITTLPETITETILCLLPLEEAARTSILSREWRYKWTTIPKLVFDESTVKMPTEDEHLSRVERATRDKDIRCKLVSAIHQVLLLRQGPIHELTLSVYADHTCFEIDQIIFHLSRNHTVKKLTLDLGAYSLPGSFFSLHHLTDLCLESCELRRTPLFDKFGSLTSLTLREVMVTKETLLHLLSNCPSLKSLSLFVRPENFYGEIPSMMQLLKCLPMIEHLTTWGETVTLLVHYSVPEEIPVSLIHLKYCSIEEQVFDFDDVRGLTSLVVLIKCAPNLEKIELQLGASDDYDEEWDNCKEYAGLLKEYSVVWLERLNELKIDLFENMRPDLEFVKFILARSPSLKKLILKTYLGKNEELKLLRILLRAPRVSPVEVVVENGCKR